MQNDKSRLIEIDSDDAYYDDYHGRALDLAERGRVYACVWHRSSHRTPQSTVQSTAYLRTSFAVFVRILENVALIAQYVRSIDLSIDRSTSIRNNAFSYSITDCGTSEPDRADSHDLFVASLISPTRYSVGPLASLGGKPISCLASSPQDPLQNRQPQPAFPRGE